MQAIEVQRTEMHLEGGGGAFFLVCVCSPCYIGGIQTMGKRLAIIGASYLQLPLVTKAREMGLETVCFAWAEGAVCKDFCDAFFPVSITEKERIAEICREQKIDGVATIASDVAVPTVCHVANCLGLNGNSERSALLSTNKNAMRAAFRIHGVNSPPSERVCTVEEGVAVAERIGWPLIVKPADRSGSMGVSRVEDADALKRAVGQALADSLCGEAVVERFIENAREISIEGISHGGEYHLLAATDKVTTGAPHYVELAHHQPSALPSDILARAAEQAERGVQALEIREGATHSELMVTPLGDVYVTEIGARMGGDFIGSDLVPLSTGYDFLRGVIEVAVGGFVPPRRTETHHAGVWFYTAETPLAGEVIRGAVRHPEIVRAEITDPVLRPLSRSADRSGYFIYRADRRLDCRDFTTRFKE